jgi:diaminopropionate ammonia-lyase
VAKLMRDPSLARAVGLDASSRVLVISTEGATAPGVYAELVGISAGMVASRRDERVGQLAR